jgi:alpha-1,2-mannosyltransferase
VLLLALAGCATYCAWVAVHRPRWDRQADLAVYADAVRAVRHGVPLYRFRAPNGDLFTYPPFALLVLWPTALASFETVRLAWTVASCVAICALAACLVRGLPISDRRTRVGGTALMALMALVLLASAPEQSNLRFGQVSLFVALAALVDAVEMTPRQMRGVPLGLAAAVKLTPLLFVPYLLCTGRRRDALRAAATFVAATTLGLLVLPGASLAYWTHDVFSTSRIGELTQGGDQSVNAVLLRFGVHGTFGALVWATIAVPICVCAVRGAARLHAAGQLAAGAVLVGCATLAASPVSWTHHQVWLVLAGFVMLADRDWRGLPLLVLLNDASQRLVVTDLRTLLAVAVCLAWPRRATSGSTHGLVTYDGTEPAERGRECGRATRPSSDAMPPTAGRP